MAISSVNTVWRAFDALTKKFHRLRFDFSDIKEDSNLSFATVDDSLSSGKGRTIFMFIYSYGNHFELLAKMACSFKW